MPSRGEAYPGEFPSLGPQIVIRIEDYLIHGPGDVMGEPIVLDDEFYEFVVRAYRIDPETGRRRYRRAFLSRAKGRAKSSSTGMLACAEALGPVRFDGWDANGEPVGRPVKSPFIRCRATEEGQAGNTFDNVSSMMAHLAEHHGETFPGIDFGRSSQTSSRIILHHRHGEVVPSTAGSASKDGGKETFAVFDETHLYVLPELRRMQRHGAPLHANCDCRVEPVFGEADQVLDPELADAVKAAVAELTGNDDRKPDLRRLLASMTPEHGELGPVLVRPRNHFTTSAELPI
jgi:hypothetical protein